MQLEATITSSDEPDSLQYTKELFSFPIPDAGIEVEGIFKLGATLSYDVGVSSTFSGSATVDFGLQAGVPDSAQVVADIQNPDSSAATGWGGATLTPLFDIKKESASVKLAAFSQPKLAFGIELIEIGNFDVALTVKLPEVSVTLTAAYDENGLCGAGSLKTGVKLDSEVDIEVDLQIDTELGEDEDTVKPSWSHTLYAYPIPLGSLCFPLDIPGLNLSSNATSSVPSLPALTSQSLVTAAVTLGSVSSVAVNGTMSVTGTTSGSMTSDEPNGFSGLQALTGISAPGAFQTTSNAKSGQSTAPGPTTLALRIGSSDLTPASSAATLTPTDLVTASRSDSSTTATSGTVSDLDLPNDRLKAIVAHSHTSSLPPSSSDVFPFSSLAGDGQLSNVITPTTTPLASTPTSSKSIASTTVAIGTADTKGAVVHSHISSMPPASSNTLLSSGLSDQHDIFAAASPGTTTIPLSSATIRSSTSIPAVLDGPEDKKAVVAHPKTTATTKPAKSSIPSSKPKSTPTSDVLPKVNPAVGKDIEDLPPKPKVTPSAPKSKVTPPAVVPMSTPKRITPASTTTPANGGGGCRRVKRFGKRMLVC